MLDSGVLTRLQQRALRHQRLIALITLAALVAIVFAPCLRAGFVWDDSGNVVDNYNIVTGTWHSYLRFWQTGFLSLYVPLTYSVWTVLTLLCNAMGPQGPLPWVFHAANLAVHALNAWLVFLLARRLLPGRFSAALAAAALFAVHPLQVEAVAWVTSMKDLLAAAFALLSLHAHVSAHGSAAGTKRWLMRGLSILAFLAAVLAKPSAVCLPAIAAAVDVVFLGRRYRQALLTLVAGAIAVLPIILWTMSLQGVNTARLPPTALWQRCLVALDASLFYARKALWPGALAIDYAHQLRGVLNRPPLIPGLQCLFVGLCLLAAWKMRGWRPLRLIVGGILLFLLAIAPCSGLVPFQFQLMGTVADRYAYFAMLGPALIVAALLPARRGMVTATLIILVAIAGFVARRQTQFWQSDSTVFQHALDLNPKSAIALSGMGVIQADHGQYEDARRSYEEAAKADPLDARPWINLAALFIRTNRSAEGEPYVRHALELDPGAFEAHNNLGAILLNRGMPEAAAREFETALALKPNYLRALTNLANVLITLNRFDEADRYLTQAITLTGGNASDPSPFLLAGEVQLEHGDPHVAEARFARAAALAPGSLAAHKGLGEAMARQGKTEAAIAELETALRLDPRQVDVLSTLAAELRTANRRDEAEARLRALTLLAPQDFRARANLGVLLSEGGNYAAAAKELQVAADLRPGDSAVLFNLGSILLKAGELTAAEKSLSQALALSPENPDIRFVLGDVLMREGHVAAALPHLRAAAKAYPEDPQAAELLGRAERRHTH